MSDLHELSIANWRTIRVPTRRLCISHLRDALLPAHAHIVETWKDEVKAGQRIGSAMKGEFHFGPGMGLRNILRQVVADIELPPISYTLNEAHRNWDDFYYGAIDAFIREEIDRTG